MEGWSTSTEYYRKNYEYPIGLARVDNLVQINFFEKTEGELEDKYKATTVRHINDTDEYTSIAGSELFGQAGIYVLLSGLEPDISHIIKIEYMYEDGRIEYAISEPTEKVCFVAGTKVYTETGLINIENIEEGMKVYSKNRTTGEKELKTVLSTSKNDTNVDTYKIYINEECIEGTGIHPYYVKNKGFIEEKDLLIGDVLIDVNNEEKIIGNIEIVKNLQIIKVYNMNVAENHNYYVGENMILVHNAAECLR